ncbi:MAG: YdjY domain-containing protein [Planctomycetota bacterium]
MLKQDLWSTRCRRVICTLMRGMAALSLTSLGMAATPDAELAEGRPDHSTKATSAPIPGISLHREAGFLDLDATVIGHGCEWLELVACTPGSREHEALVTIDAKPSDLHLALLLLGMDPGTPQTGVRGDEGWTIVPPTGPKVDLQFVLTTEEGQGERLVPVESWVFDRAADAPLVDHPDGGWIFTGSRFVRDSRDPQSPEVYLADVNGTAVSLVHFGDETIGRDTAVTESDDGQNLTPHAEVMPPNGTRIRLRISALRLNAGQPEP